MRCRLPEGKSRADFPEVSSQLLDRSEWKIGGVRWFLPRRKIIILEARSFLYAVHCRKSLSVGTRPDFFCDNLALVLALCKGRSKHFALLSVMRRIFATGFRISLVVEVGTVGVGYSDKGSRSCDCDYDSSKSLLHVLAQRLTRASPAQTCDLNCFPFQLMHLDDGEVDLTSHIDAPAVSVQSHVSSDVLIARDT